MKNGDLLLNKYIVIKLIAQRDFTNLYLIEYKKKKYILKEYKARINSKDYENLVYNNFSCEYEHLTKFSSKNIVKIEKKLEINGINYLVLEYCKGTTLKEFILTNDLSVTEILNIFINILIAVKEIHKNSIVHMDIKATNIIINMNFEIKIIDFDSAISIKQNNKLIIKITDGYSAPELYSTKIAIDERADIYSLFSLLYFMLYKQVPMSIINRFYYPELLFDNKINIEVKNLIKKGLSFDRKNRFKNIDEILEKLLLKNCY